jgi:plasmid stabilization system protein ParE
MKRDDIRLGLRITGFRRRVAIAFTVSETDISILGIFYGGQNYEPALEN